VATLVTEDPVVPSNVVDRRVDPIAKLYRESVIHNGKHLPGFSVHADPRALVGKTAAVRPLEQSRAKPGVNAIRAAQNRVRRLRVSEVAVPSVRVGVLRGRVPAKQRRVHR
jgi:hypothetical protein